MAKSNSPVHHKICLGCGKPMTARNSRRAYHDDKCKMRYFRNKLKQEEAEKNRPPLPEEAELAEVVKKIPMVEQQLVPFPERIKTAEQQLNASQWEDKTLLFQKATLKSRRDKLVRLHGKFKSGADMARLGFSFGKTPLERVKNGLIGAAVDRLIGSQPVYYNFSSEIKEIDGKIGKLGKTLSNTPYLEKQVNDLKRQYAALKSELQGLTERKGKLEEIIGQKKNSKDIEKLKNAQGMISAKDIQFISFEDRIILSGDIGAFLGRLEKKRCAITLSGEQGGGKTYLCFDIAKAFIRDKNFTVAYFSLEEGIADITKDKLKAYDLLKEANLHFAETGTLKDIHHAAGIFHVVIIDSWNKLDADINEFDKLRVKYPNTIFLVIFQLTTSGQLRGGTKAVFDAAANIHVWREDNKRFAQFRKNRYGSTHFVYSIDERKLVSP